MTCVFQFAALLTAKILAPLFFIVPFVFKDVLPQKYIFYDAVFLSSKKMEAEVETHTCTLTFAHHHQKTSLRKKKNFVSSSKLSSLSSPRVTHLFSVGDDNTTKNNNERQTIKCFEKKSRIIETVETGVFLVWLF